jgi:hypothetical protein
MQAQENHAMRQLFRLGVAAAAAALLTACGGGGADDPVAPPAVPTDAVPDSAIASVRAYTEFAGQLIADKRAAGAARYLWIEAADRSACQPVEQGVAQGGVVRAVVVAAGQRPFQIAQRGRQVHGGLAPAGRHAPAVQASTRGRAAGPARAAARRQVPVSAAAGFRCAG